MSVDGTPTRQVLVEAHDVNAALIVHVGRLAEAVRGLAVDLATARRDCRDKQQRIDSLRAENARLRRRRTSR